MVALQYERKVGLLEVRGGTETSLVIPTYILRQPWSCAAQEGLDPVHQLGLRESTGINLPRLCTRTFTFTWELVPPYNGRRAQNSSREALRTVSLPKCYYYPPRSYAAGMLQQEVVIFRC